MDTNDQPRWAPKNRGSFDPTERTQCHFIGQAGRLDVWVDMKDLDLSVFTDGDLTERRHNFTIFIPDSDGCLRPNDSDVVPTPYELCLIYQLLEQSGYDITRGEDYDSDS